MAIFKPFIDAFTVEGSTIADRYETLKEYDEARHRAMTAATPPPPMGTVAPATPAWTTTHLPPTTHALIGFDEHQLQHVLKELHSVGLTQGDLVAVVESYCRAVRKVENEK